MKKLKIIKILGVKGDMHNNEGVLMREVGFTNYTEGLRGFLGIE